MFSVISLLEEHGLTRTPLPGPRALRRWRREAPDEVAFSLVAPAGLFEPGDNGDQSLELTRAAVEALEPEVLLLRPAISVAPSQSSRDRLRDLAGAGLCDRGQLVFWPTGLWEPETTAALADELDLSVVINPLASDPQDRDRALWERELGRGTAYLRLERLPGGGRRFDDYELDEIADLVESLDRGWVIFSHAEALRDVHALRQKLDQQLGQNS